MGEGEDMGKVVQIHTRRLLVATLSFVLQMETYRTMYIAHILVNTHTTTILPKVTRDCKNMLNSAAGLNDASSANLHGCSYWA